MKEQENNEITVSISFEPVTETKKTLISYKFTTLVEDLDKGFRCYIPGFDIYFFAPTEEEGRKIGISVTRTFFNFWLKKQGKRAFLLELHKRGFRTTNHTFSMASMLKRKSISKLNNFKLTRYNLLPGFHTAQKFNEEADFAIAV